MPSGHFSEAESETRMGGFTERGDRIRELCDHKTEWGSDGMSERELL